MGSTGFFIADILKDIERYEDEESNSSTSTKDTFSWSEKNKPLNLPLPAWIFCTRYSDRPSSELKLSRIPGM
ncbi:unnamed protein product [Rodentolepis nana]|uniref:Uncharacterized protein n=1 Tax=Rodentolepis nana TaxID=102285 RepID=A0A158QGQ8_RODNA|nr:unnamed protein product [Rodentolepis nana]